MKELEIIRKNEIEVIDSRLVAERLDIQHKNLLETIKTHKITIENHFGDVAFETVTLINSINAAHQVTFCYLTEDQAIFITTLSRNTEIVINFKAELVKAFRKYKELQPIIPTYNLPKTKLEALKALVVAEEIIERQNEQLLLAQPKINFFDTVADTKDCFDLKEVAKMLKVPNGKGFLGSNQIFEKLRNLGYLMKNNTPYQNKVNDELFKVIEISYNQGSTVKATTKTLVTQKGLVHFQKLFNIN